MSRFDRGNENQGRGPHPSDLSDLTLADWLKFALLAAIMVGALSLFDPPESAPVVVAQECR